MESNVSGFIRDLNGWKWINFSEKKERGKEREGIYVYIYI